MLPEGAKIATRISGLGIEVFYDFFKNGKNKKICIISGWVQWEMLYQQRLKWLCSIRGKKCCIEGDGRLQMNIQELALARELNLPIVLIIMNNGDYPSIRNNKTTYFKKHLIRFCSDTGLHLPDLEKIALGYDIPYTAIRNLDKLSGVL